MLGHEASSWSVWCQEEDIEKVREDQERKEYRESALSSDHMSDYISTTSWRLKETKAWRVKKLSELQRMKDKKIED